MFHVFIDGETAGATTHRRDGLAFGLRPRGPRRPAHRRGVIRRRWKAAAGDVAHARSPRSAVQMARGAVSTIQALRPLPPWRPLLLPVDGTGADARSRRPAAARARAALWHRWSRGGAPADDAYSLRQVH